MAGLPACDLYLFSVRNWFWHKSDRVYLMLAAYTQKNSAAGKGGGVPLLMEVVLVRLKPVPAYTYTTHPWHTRGIVYWNATTRIWRHSGTRCCRMNVISASVIEHKQSCYDIQEFPKTLAILTPWYDTYGIRVYIIPGIYNIYIY